MTDLSGDSSPAAQNDSVIVTTTAREWGKKHGIPPNQASMLVRRRLPEAVVSGGDRKAPLIIDPVLADRLLFLRGGYKKREKPVREYRRRNNPRSSGKYAAQRPCLKCEKDFHSPDRRKIKICTPCKNSPEWGYAESYESYDCGGAVGDGGRY